MAFVDENAASPAVAPQAQNGPIAAGGAGIGGGTTKAASTPGVNVPQQPSAQLRDYLSANQPQTTAFAGNIANAVGQQTQAAGNAILPAVNTYTGQLYTVPQDQATNQAVATAPSTLTADQTASFQKQLGAAASAPNSAATFETTQPYQGLVSGIQQAVEQANLWNSGNNPANLSTALQPFEAPGTTQGNVTLDALLLSQTPGAYNQITNAVAPAANLQGNLQAGVAQADAALQNAIATDTATTAAATAAPQTYANNLATYLKNAVATATQGDTATNATIMSDLAANKPTPADLATLGVTPEQWNTLSGYMAAATQAGGPITLSNYLTQAAPNAIVENVASPTQYADIAALQSLLGSNAPTAPITSTTANLAGTALTPATENQFNLVGAEEAAQLAPLEAQAQAIVNAGNYANQQYGVNHFGGQSPDQFNQYIAGLNAQLSAINSKIQALSATFPQYNGAASVNAGGSSGGVNAGSVANAIFPVAALANVPILSNISSIASDIGNFFGFAEGGQVADDKRPAYMGAT